MATLYEQLQKLKAKVAEKTSEEFQRITAAGVQELIDSQAIKGLAIGTTAPDFSLPDSEGNKVSLVESLKQGPVILSFYRGSW